MMLPQLQEHSSRNVNSSQEVECLISCSTAKPHTWKSRHDPKISRISEQFSGSYNKPSLSSAGKKNNRQTPKLPMHLQWIIWLLVTFVWHNLCGIHKLLFVFWCSKPANSQQAKPSDFHINPAGRRLAGLRFSLLVRMHKPGCMEVTRVEHTNIQCTSTRSCGILHIPRKELPKHLTPWGTALGSEWEDPVHWIKISLPTFPTSVSGPPPQWPSSVGWPLAIAHSPQFV